ncbi:DUF4238 domain-containing protein [Serratia marcescens]|uniref:DUF4238 domain-containing protein n=1 Tax=Serratia sp. SCBI TaxID=488142 RepID=UPI0005B31172|nr:DUF4238 domain-containing protein [Serratia sp. SCBI]BEM94992.1 hypothetical protein SME53J_44310 [Serratia marcescens]
MTRKDLEAKKRHHYVWANYLTRWGNGTKNVSYTTKTGKIANDSVRAIVADDYFYKTTTLTSRHVEIIKSLSRNSPAHLHEQHMAYLKDILKMQSLEKLYNISGAQDKEAEAFIHASKCNLMENLHSSHEYKALPILDALADGQLDILQNKQRMIEFMMFFGHQITRTKPFRDCVLRVQPRRNTLEIEVADAMEHAWWFISYMFGMSIGWSLYSSRHDNGHSLLLNDTGQPFITSDHPIVNVHSCVSETDLIAPEYADLYYPISPNIAYIICDSKRFATGKTHVDEVTVNELNTKMATQAMVHIIGNTESIILSLKKHIGRRYNKKNSFL